MAQQKIVLKNKKANHQYFLEEKFTAGIQLHGTEIKSIRAGKASVNEGYCYFRGNELFVQMHIAEYSHGGSFNHDPKRPRKLLLNRRELKKLQNKVTIRGYTIVPVKLFINNQGLAKLEIALAKGKKMHDKREDIKQKDIKRELDRMKIR